MIAVGIREMKNRLSEYVRRVRAGETVLVTDRGRVVAQLSPPGPNAEVARDALSPLEDRGLLSRRGATNASELYPELPRVAPSTTSEALLDELRGER